MATRVGSKKYEKERNKFFKKNGGKGFEYHGWWYFHGHEHLMDRVWYAKEENIKSKKSS